MAKKSSAPEDLIPIASKLPWWTRLALALASIAGRRKRRRLLNTVGTPGGNTQWVDGIAAAKQPAQRPRAEVVSKRVEPVHAPKVVKAPPAVRKAPPAPVQPKAPACPHCRKPMVIKVARTGGNAGGNFWGCADYPKCRGIRAIFAGGDLRKPKSP